MRWPPWRTASVRGQCPVCAWWTCGQCQASVASHRCWRPPCCKPSPSALPEVNKAWCSLTDEVTRRCCTVLLAVGKVPARTAVLGACSTRATALCVAITAALPSGYRALALIAATWISAPSVEAQRSWKNNSRPCCPAPALPASTPTAHVCKVRCKRSWRRCTQAKWTCWWAHKWWPKGTTFGA